MKVLELFLDDFVDFGFRYFPIKMNHPVSVSGHLGKLLGGEIGWDHLIFLKEAGDIFIGSRPGPWDSRE